MCVVFGVTGCKNDTSNSEQTNLRNEQGEDYVGYYSFILNDSIDLKDLDNQEKIRILKSLIDSMSVSNNKSYRDEMIYHFYDKIESEELSSLGEISQIMREIDLLDSKIIQLKNSIPRSEFNKDPYIATKYQRYEERINVDRMTREAAFQSWKRGTDHLRDSATH